MMEIRDLTLNRSHAVEVCTPTPLPEKFVHRPRCRKSLYTDPVVGKVCTPTPLPEKLNVTMIPDVIFIYWEKLTI
jgi:hypothetical protein